MDMSSSSASTGDCPAIAGYDASLDRVHAAAADDVGSRFTAGGQTTPRTFSYEYPNPARGWDHSVGTLAIVRPGQPDEVVLSREKERLALCINSFSTRAGGVVAPLVDVGRGDRDEDYAGKTI